MKYFMPVAWALVASAAAATPAHKRASYPAPPVKPLPVFSFLGDDTETVTHRASLNATKCTEKDGKLDCTDFDDPKIAGQTLKWLSLSYYNGKLYHVFSEFNQGSWSEILTAFTAKYGEPKIGTEKWQAKSGATFDNEVATWPFKGGTLKLSRLGLDLDSADFEFEALGNAPPADKPKVDF